MRIRLFASTAIIASLAGTAAAQMVVETKLTNGGTIVVEGKIPPAPGWTGG